MIPVISVVGKSNTGKTTLLEKLIPELKSRGYRVATIKHDAHSFEIDHPGKDSWRHAQAGSDVVVVSSPRRLALIANLEAERSLDQIIELIQEVDIILTEGYKRGDKLKVEVSRRERGRELLCNQEELIAVATDEPYPGLTVPQYDINDAAGLADLLVSRFLGRRPPGSAGVRSCPLTRR